jgi:NodT family efflux transporter outer membrane factor (OMF) lipoprotein
MSMMWRAASGAALLALAGCTMGPDYHLPDQSAAKKPAAQAPFSSANPHVTSGAVPQRWWRLYDDPVLDKLQEEALAANTDLRVAGANLARARAVSRAAEGANEPEISVDAAAQRARLSGESYLLDHALPVMNLGGAGVGVSYQIDLFGRLRRATESAKADEEATEELVHAVQVTLAADVTQSYLDLCGAQEALELISQAAEIQDHLVEVTHRLRKAGRLGTPEVTIAEQRAAEAHALLPVERAKARAALFRLAFLMGRAPADYPREAEGCHHVPLLEHPLPVGDGASLIARRPDLRAAERRLAAATARIGVATAELYPQIGIGLSGGSTGLLADLGQAPANRWGIGSLIHWSFPTAGARARVSAAHADADRALAQFDGAVLDALRETETVITTYGENHNRLLALDEAREAAEEAAEQARRLRAAGRAAVQVDLGGQSALLAARLREVAAHDAVARDQVLLFLALGGGW